MDQKVKTLVRVRCPSASCGELFETPEWRIGRNQYCPSCGVRMTARPVRFEGELRRKAERAREGGQAEPGRLPLVVLVDNVRSLWNVGSIFRTADACSVGHLIPTGICGHPPRPEISKTALGAEESVRWSYRADAVEALAEWTERGYVPVALESDPAAPSVASFPWPQNTCLVLGNEVAGVAPELLARCEHRVAIPMGGVKSSLNVAVAFGIAAFAAASAIAALRDSPREIAR